MLFKIYAARSEDAHQGWVWLQRPKLASRGVICIVNPANNKKTYCEALQIERNFLNSYNQAPRLTISASTSALVIGEWFRAKLDIKTEEEVDLEILPCKGGWGQFRACTEHPQVVVRVAAWLGFVGLILGVIGLALGIASLQ